MESAIDSYRAMASVVMPSTADVKKRLRTVSKLTSTLANELRDLATNPRALVALTLGVESHDFKEAMGEGIAKVEISQDTEILDRLARWLASAEEKLLPARPGAREKSIAIQLLITNLDQTLLQFTDRPISRSTNRNKIGRDYIRTVCQIADPAIGLSSIEEAMKRQITARGGISSSKPS